MKSITVSASANLTPLDRLDILNIIYQQNPSPELQLWVLYGNEYVHGGTSHLNRTAWWHPDDGVFYDGVGEVNIYVPPEPTPEIIRLNSEISDAYKLLYPRKTHLHIEDHDQPLSIAALKRAITNSTQRLIKDLLTNLKTRKWELEIAPLRAWLDARRAAGSTEVVLWPDDLSTLMVGYGVEMRYNTKKKTVWFQVSGNVRSPHPVCLSLKDPAPVVLNTSTMPRVVWDLDMRRDMLIAGTVREPERVIGHLESLVIR